MTQTTLANGHLSPDQLSAFLDGELSSSETYEIQQHLSGCHACTLRVLSATQLKAATAHAAQRFVAPPEALARLTAQLRSNRFPAGWQRVRSLSLNPLTGSANSSA